MLRQHRTFLFGLVLALCLGSASTFAQSSGVEGSAQGPIPHDGQSSSWTIALALAWDSHYVSEGRDNLGGHGLVGTVIEAALDGFSLGSWYGASPSVDYQEYHLFLSYGRSVGDVDWYVGVQSVDVVGHGSTDLEVGAGLAYTGLPNWMVAVDWYHSKDASGSFFEASMHRPLILSETSVITPYLIAGWNEGYVSEGHRHGNHITTGLELSYALGASTELSAYMAHNWAIGKNEEQWLDDELLKNFAYAGFAWHWHF